MRFFIVLLLLLAPASGHCLSSAFESSVFDPGHLTPRDSVLKVKVGDPVPDFMLPAISGGQVGPSQFRGKKNLVISFIPAAWTPVCSDQWPGYNIARPLFDAHDAVLFGISVDSRATLYSWTRAMKDLWFPVLSDFWPHGQVAQSFGVLRSDGMAERAIIIVDKRGIIRFLHVSDINVRPELGMIIQALDAITP
ncbi:peroxiredoxin (AhpC/TSA family protein) [Desulforapulum autotrophicum HRM2]|jgi:peroxiredoxin (alkyl hydroperoxide reductase subunit C)|uniref:Peroxiredoxin (AhpC/TSA family protein) n=1 Tax=Desulforapulum autotrophicum (strain ATCC 43914 / DSM 3382 / VKM B-1955 / HRM2) TaxID=177437 RepID=C0QCD5_DESAH|nr:peroxiredoxin [Desulforapulum autotrophicum]ACN17152.1 peroxiredoxin (AhpC/TSA family protein) [Desulforapulum autotrophicum HRM2]